MAGGSVGELGEFGLIDEIIRDLPMTRGVVLGAGDDCAVFSAEGNVAVSTDTMVADRHWKDTWSSPRDVGRKAVAAAVADLEAVGARPIGLVISLAVPTTLAADWVRDFAAGVRQECERAGAGLLGGDTTAAPTAVVTVTVFGDLQGRDPVTRAGARPGDVVALKGRLGWAEAGRAVLNRGFRSPAAVVNAHRVPEPPYGAGAAAARAGASAMIDVSDGLLADLGHVARASGVTIQLQTSHFDIAEPQRAVAGAIGRRDPLGFILTGGDDHALTATFAAGDVPDGWRVIGHIEAGEPIVLVDGAVWEGPQGWDHFSGGRG